MTTATTATDIIIEPFGDHDGQKAILGDYRARTLAAIAGTGGGKTQLGYWWLYLRMLKYPGYGWLVAEPTFNMLAKILLNSSDPNRPTLEQWFRRVGWHPNYKAVDKILETDYGKIYLASADNPDSMQGAAVKGAWLDEGGMMSLIAHQTALQRVSLFDGQELITTTPYNRGWLKTEIADKADGDYIHVEKWKSIANPAFPKHVYEEMRSGPNAMQRYRFRMMYDAEFERPTGMIYGNFNADKCVIEPFNIPKAWPRYVGIDYGPVHTAVLWFAKTPNKYKGWPAGTYFAYREYLEGNKSIKQHAKDLNALGKGEDIVRKTGSAVAAERQWRREYSEAGFYVQECSINDVEVGIDRVYALHAHDGIVYFNTMTHTLSQKEDYSRKLDASQEPTDAIDKKAEYHFMDAERYLVASGTSRRPIFEA